MPVALFVEGAPPSHLTGGNLLGYGYLSLIGAALTYALWFRGIRALPPTSVSFLSLLSPVVATAIGWLALGQDLSPLQALGALIVLGSLIAAQTRRRPGTTTPSAPAAPDAPAAPASASAPPVRENA